MDTGDDAATIIGGLIRMCEVGARGLRIAAEGVTRSDASEVFTTGAQLYTNFARELEGEMRQFGGERPVAVFGGVPARRETSRIAEAVKAGDEVEIIAGCDLVGISLMDTYVGALSRQLPGRTREIIVRQYDQISETGRRIHELNTGLGGDRIIRPPRLRDEEPSGEN